MPMKRSRSKRDEEEEDEDEQHQMPTSDEEEEQEDEDEDDDETQKLDEDEEEVEDEEDDEDDDEEEENEKSKKLKKEQDEKEASSSKYDGMKAAIKQELNQMSFEDVLKLQNKLGLKKYKEVMNQHEEDEAAAANRKKNFTRLNKNRPQEMSSKRPVSFFRNVFQTKTKHEAIDPRFSSAFGEYKPELFRKGYSFIHDLRHKEKDMLTDQLKKEADPETKVKIKTALLRLKQQIKSFEEAEKKESLKDKFKKQAAQDAKEGKRPHFVNKSEQKIVELAEKYKELKKTGQITNYLAKKRKKQLSKDSKHLSRNEMLA